MLKKYIFFLLALISAIIALFNKKESGFSKNIYLKEVNNQVQHSFMEIQQTNLSPTLQQRPCPYGYDYNLEAWDDFFQQPDNDTIANEFQDWAMSCLEQIKSIGRLKYTKDNNIALPNINVLQQILPFFILNALELTLIKVGLKDIDGIQYVKFNQSEKYWKYFILRFCDNDIQDLSPLKQLSFNNDYMNELNLNFQNNKIQNVSNLFSSQQFQSGFFILEFGENQIQIMDIFNNCTFNATLFSLNMSYNLLEEIQIKQSFNSDFNFFFNNNRLRQIDIVILSEKRGLLILDHNEINQINLKVQSLKQLNISLQQNQLKQNINELQLFYIGSLVINLNFNNLQKAQVCQKCNITGLDEVIIDYSYNLIKNANIKEDFFQNFQQIKSLSLNLQSNQLENFSFCDKCLNYPLQKLFLDLSNNINCSSIDQIYEDLKSFKSISQLNQTFNNNSITKIGRAFDQYFHDTTNLQIVVLHLEQNQISQDDKTFLRRVFAYLHQKGVFALIYF